VRQVPEEGGWRLVRVRYESVGGTQFATDITAGGMPTACFRLSVKLTDPTGTLERVSLFGQLAETFLGCNVNEFLQLDQAARDRLHREKLWSRYKVIFKVH
jgi:hypothetical protein